MTARVVTVGMAFLAGFGLGFFMDHRSEETSVDIASSRSHSTDTGPGQAHEPAANTAPSADRTSDALTRVLAAIPSPSFAEGEGVIRGHVRTERGDPLAGAAVAVYPDVRGAGAETVNAEGLDETVVRILAEAKRKASGLRKATSDDDGGFALQGLVEAPYTIEGTLAGYEITLLSPAVGRVHPGATVELLAQAVRDVEIEVTYADGSLPEVATVEWRLTDYRKSRKSEAEWRPGDRRLRLSPGAYVLSARAGSGNEFRSEGVIVEVSEAGGIQAVTLLLETRAGIRGRVLFPNGDAMTTTVCALPWSAAEAPSDDEIRGRGRRVTARAQSAHRYELFDLPRGPYVMAASRLPGRWEIIEEVMVPDHLVSRDLVLGALDPSSYVIVFVYAPDGELTRDVLFRSGYETKGGSSHHGDVPAERQDDGSFRVLLRLPDASEEDVRHYLDVQSSRWGNRRIEFTPTRAGPLECRFPDPAWLQVDLAGYQGSGMEGRVYVELEPPVGGTHFREPGSSGEPDPEGQVRLGPVDPGEYELTLRVRSERGSDYSQAVLVTLVGGENRRTIELPRFHPVIVLCDERFRGESITALVLREREGGRFTFRYGGRDDPLTNRLEFEDIPEGECLFRCNAAGDLWQMSVSVSGPTTLRFEPRRVNALRVRVDEPSAELARLGYRTGDLVIGVDGEEFRTNRHMDFLLDGARAKDEVWLMILRGPESLELPYDPKLGRGGDRLGGRLEEATRE